MLVLDNVHLLRSRQSARTVSALAEHIPDESTLVLAGRALPRLPIARVRTSGRLLEVEWNSLHRAGARSSALARCRRRLRRGGRRRADRPNRRLAGRRLPRRAGAQGRKSKPGCPSVEGDDRFVADYFDFELLSRLAPRDVRFLTRTAVLDRMCGSLCDAVLETTGSASKSSRSRGRTSPRATRRRRGWYRYHHEFREFRASWSGASQARHRAQPAGCDVVRG